MRGLRHGASSGGKRTVEELVAIGLLVYCVRRTSAPRALIKVYVTFYSNICRKKEYPGIPDDFTPRIAESNNILRNLSMINCPWALVTADSSVLRERGARRHLSRRAG
ncbi:hypothetical protein EDB19DRAFT_1831747 [Suillus lakei]|nr:hypothetical protein EDB19DRAFT_1831747 [Suillus lakei]